LSSAASFSTKFYQLGPVRRLERWLNAMPHPSLVVEIAGGHVAAARWGATGSALESFAVEPLPFGAVSASPVEPNVSQPDEVRNALRRVLSRVPDRGQGLALLIPDQVVRVFILPFETLPRRADEALPLLRWRLKKSVPFDVDETVVSWMRQTGKGGGLQVVASVARQRIVREYEEIVNGLGTTASIVLSSTLATLPLLEERGATILVRMSGKALTTVISQGANLSVYRSTDVSGDASSLEPQAMLDEIFPAIAYHQDTWGVAIERGRISGFGARETVFNRALSEELKCPVASLAESENARALDSRAKDLMRQDLDGLVGWMMNQG
jgi:type IV pilus assembly protein PilM